MTKPALFWRRLTWARLMGILTLGALASTALVVGSDAWVRRAAANHCTSIVADLPPHPVGLVLGCAPSVDGRPNRFFEKRMAAAAQLYSLGRVQALIVSGDNGTRGYDEPTAMKDDLVQRGVPEASIFCDFAGFRTLDSVVRAQRIFGQSRLIIVSQRFHNERAVFLAQRHGLTAAGYDAVEVPLRSSLMTAIREYFARVKAVLDVTLLRTQPKFGGPPISIPLA